MSAPIHFPSAVMAGLVPAIHVFNPQRCKGVDTRDKRGHDAEEVVRVSAMFSLCS